VTSTELHIPGLVIVEHEFSVPLDHARPDGQQITVFAREVADPDGRDRPYLLYLQGGPGTEANRPTTFPSTPSWLPRALQDYRVLLLDQRGTGRSTPIGALPGMTPQQQAEYLTHFRADAIVRDAELIREQLGVKRWSILGQSFGGFTSMVYLSIAPEGLAEAFLTGGLAPIGRHVDEIYAATYEIVLERSRRYYRRYPDDLKRVREIQRRLAAEEILLPNGDRLTARRFRQLGLMLGMSDGAEHLHYIIELPVGSPAFAHDVASGVSFERNPLYAILHESSYADGCVTGWSAQRLQPEEYERHAEYFTGEHVFPWMFEEYGGLAPLREAADIVAAYQWPRMFDPQQLAANEVPAAAAIYDEDMYVVRDFSRESAAAIKGLHTWVTSEYQHNGLRADGARVLGHLIDLARGRA
jgi:pimeloyl-ACP methyl ester carboxylesterase